MAKPRQWQNSLAWCGATIMSHACRHTTQRHFFEQFFICQWLHIGRKQTTTIIAIKWAPHRRGLYVCALLLLRAAQPLEHACFIMAYFFNLFHDHHALTRSWPTYLLFGWSNEGEYILPHNGRTVTDSQTSEQWKVLNPQGNSSKFHGV